MQTFLHLFLSIYLSSLKSLLLLNFILVAVFTVFSLQKVKWKFEWLTFFKDYGKNCAVIRTEEIMAWTKCKLQDMCYVYVIPRLCAVLNICKRIARCCNYGIFCSGFWWWWSCELFIWEFYFEVREMQRCNQGSRSSNVVIPKSSSTQ